VLWAACKDAVMEASASRTALRVAVGRGLHRLWDAPPWILDDPFALILVGPEWQELVGSSSNPVLRQAIAELVVRSRYAEDRLARGTFSQYVILGAGLDSFAWRRPDLLRSLRVFEVDHPASQAWKRQRIDKLGLPTSDQLVFAPVDFEVQSLHDGLDAAGFDWTQPSMFLWMGVAMYLTVDAIEATLRTVAECRSGSAIVFDYFVTDPYLDDVGREHLAVWLPIAARAREPVQTRWSPTEAEQVVLRCGLQVADHPSRDELVRRYFADRTDGLQPVSSSRLIAATVP